MKHLADWISRLRSASPDDLKERIFRAIIPGWQTVALADAIIKLETLGAAQGRPGATRQESALLLRFWDSAPIGQSSLLVATDIGAGISLVSDRKFEVALEMPISQEGHGELLNFLDFGPSIDPTCRGALAADLREEFNDYLARVTSLSESDADRLGAATRLHYGAMVLVDHDIRTAYLLLVAALEVLSREYGNPPTDWAAWDGSESWEELFDSNHLRPDQAQAVREHLMRDRQLRLKATFRNYVVESLPDSFWDRPWEECIPQLEMSKGVADWRPSRQNQRSVAEFLPKDRSILRGSLGKTYDLRSGLVHAGDELHLYQSSLAAAAPVTARDALPYPVLRKIVLALLRQEFNARSTVRELPNIRAD